MKHFAFCDAGDALRGKTFRVGIEIPFRSPEILHHIPRIERKDHRNAAEQFPGKNGEGILMGPAAVCFPGEPSHRLDVHERHPARDRMRIMPKEPSVMIA